MWSNEWPSEPGPYWFYGQAFPSSYKELHFVCVWRILNGLAFVTNGHFMYEQEAVGKWAKAQPPDPPEE